MPSILIVRRFYMLLVFEGVMKFAYRIYCGFGQNSLKANFFIADFKNQFFAFPQNIVY